MELAVVEAQEVQRALELLALAAQVVVVVESASLCCRVRKCLLHTPLASFLSASVQVVLLARV